MANIKDVSAVIASALDEIGVTGKLDVSTDGGETVGASASRTGDDLEVVVVVKPIAPLGVPKTNH